VKADSGGRDCASLAGVPAAKQRGATNTTTATMIGSNERAEAAVML
jgi:hypothetical protein